MNNVSNMSFEEIAYARDCLARAREFALDELLQSIDSDRTLAYIGAEYGVFDNEDIEIVNRYLNR